MIAFGRENNSRQLKCAGYTTTWVTGGNLCSTGTDTQLQTDSYRDDFWQREASCVQTQLFNGSILFQHYSIEEKQVLAKSRQKAQSSLPDVFTCNERWIKRRNIDSARSFKKYCIQRMCSYMVGTSFRPSRGGLFHKLRIR